MAQKRKPSAEGVPNPKRHQKQTVVDEGDQIYEEVHSDAEYAVSDNESISSGSLHETPATPFSTTSSRYPSELKTHLCPVDSCTKAFNRPARLQEHLRSHSNERLFECTYDGCDKTFLRASHLNHHIKSAHTGTRDYVCDRPGCGKSFVTGTRLRRHLAAHDGRDKYRCTEHPPCSETFRKHSTLQKHVMTVHLKQKPFRCTHRDPGTGQECAMTFETAGHLRAHESRVHIEHRFTCLECSPANNGDPSSSATTDNAAAAVAFPSYALLQAHIRSVHPPQCPQCSITCSTSRELRRHLEVAHGDVSLEERKVFPCTLPGCDRSFTKKGNLTVHMRTVHGGEKRFGCGETDLSSSKRVAGWTGNGCGKRYGSKLALEEHIRTAHLGHLNAKAERRQRLGHSDSNSNSAHNNSLSTLAALTGEGYAEETGRHIPCLIESCAHRFHRDYDLWVHMSGKHEYTEDQIRDLFMQRALLADTNGHEHEPSSDILGGIYGLEFDNDDITPYDLPYMDHGHLTATLAQDPNTMATGGDGYGGLNSDATTSNDVIMQDGGDVNHMIPNYNDDNDDDMALIDPVLAYNLMEG